MKNLRLYVGVIFLVCLILGSFFLFTLKAHANVYLDNRYIDSEGLVTIVDGSAYIPLVSIAKEIGATTTWDNKTKTTTINYKDKNIFINTAKGTVSVSNKVATQKTFIKAGRTMVPIRFISEHFDFDVSWNNKNKRVDIKSKVEIPILMYHAVDNQGKLNDTLWVTTSQFDTQMKALKKAGYNSITPFQLYDYYYKGTKLPEKPILITFDDGYENNKYAYPILKKYGQQATIFGIVSRIEKEGVNSYPNEIPKLSWEDYKEMKDVFILQNHTFDSHRQVNNPNGKLKGQIATNQQVNGVSETQNQYKKRITNDLKQAQDNIHEKMGYKSVMITYPYGQYSDTVLEVVKSLNIGLGATIVNGKNGEYSSKHELNRITVNGNYSGATLVKKIQESQ